MFYRTTHGPDTQMGLQSLIKHGTPTLSKIGTTIDMF